VGAVSYLNTKPLLYGFKGHSILNEIELVEDYPAKIAQLLIDDKIDIGLIPVAIIPKLKEWHIVGDYCIGAEGPVASVCIFSELPIEQIKTVYLDYQSRTSVRLAQLLIKEYWKLDVSFIDAKGEDFRDEIKGTTAGVVIGDRALQQRSRSPYIYDLAEYWIKHTGLPFVFAAWISNKELPESFIQSFNEANRIGLNRLNEVVAENNFSCYNLMEYFTKNISYELTDEKRRGLDLFLKKIMQVD
jgi:chorismate dehydratase